MDEVRALNSKSPEWLDYSLRAEYRRESSLLSTQACFEDETIIRGKLFSIRLYFIKDNNSCQMGNFLSFVCRMQGFNRSYFSA